MLVRTSLPGWDFLSTKLICSWDTYNVGICTCTTHIITFNVINSGQPDEMEEEEPYEEGDDSDVEKQDYSWKKAIMIGQSYQASVPSDLAAYGDTLPYGKYLR